VTRSRRKLALGAVPLATILAGLVLYRTGGERRKAAHHAPSESAREEVDVSSTPRAGARALRSHRPALVLEQAPQPSEAPRKFDLQRAVALQEWRHTVQPQIDRCLPVPGADALPHTVQIVFERHDEISGPTLQRFAVAQASPLGAVPPPPEVLACLDRLRGTTVNVEVPEDELATDDARFIEQVDFRWSNGA
jgi:hypothetical protein